MLGLTARDAQDVVLYRPVGCEFCLETGFRGRTGVFVKGAVASDDHEALFRLRNPRVQRLLEIL